MTEGISGVSGSMRNPHDLFDSSRDDSVTHRPWYSVAEVALILSLCPRTIRRLIWSGQLAAVSTSPIRGRLRISREALAEFLRHATVRVQSPQSQERD